MNKFGMLKIVFVIALAFSCSEKKRTTASVSTNNADGDAISTDGNNVIVTSDPNDLGAVAGATTNGTDAVVAGNTTNNASNLSRCDGRDGTLKLYEVEDIDIDPFIESGKNTSPKTDNGLNDFERNKVTRAYNNYWYTSKYQDSGDPSPSEDQYIEYRPDFKILGVGNYEITTYVPVLSALADYKMQYDVHGYSRTEAKNKIFRLNWNQKRDITCDTTGTGPEKCYYRLKLKPRWMCEDSYVRVVDPGAEMVSFMKMEFKYLGQ